MTWDATKIEGAIQKLTGNPTSGPIAEWTPIIAAGLAEAMNPTPKSSKNETQD